MIHYFTVLTLLTAASLSAWSTVYARESRAQCNALLFCPHIEHAELEVQEEAPITEPPPSWKCSCIKAARRAGAAIPLGTNARDLIPNSPPIAGGLVILDYDGVRHAAYIIERTDYSVRVYESNFEKCKETWREIHFGDKHIVGYVSFS